MNQPERKLTIELVPKPLWGNNLAHRMTRANWSKVRLQALEEYQNACGICGSETKPLECHERWEYDDEQHIQKLRGFIVLCKNCHAIKHLGRTNIQAKAGRLQIQPIIEHYCRVNDCTEPDLHLDYSRALVEWSRRNKVDWTTDFGKYAPLVVLPPYQGYE